MLHRGVLQGVTLSSVLQGVTLSINTLDTLIISGHTHTRNTPHGITCGLRILTVIQFCNFKMCLIAQVVLFVTFTYL